MSYIQYGRPTTKEVISVFGRSKKEEGLLEALKQDCWTTKYIPINMPVLREISQITAYILFKTIETYQSLFDKNYIESGRWISDSEYDSGFFDVIHSISPEKIERARLRHGRLEKKLSDKLLRR